jgi:hypothetical protein
MNERIKELTEQARDWAEVSYKKQNDQFTSHWDNPIGYTVSQFFEQKFAELIVRECAKVSERTGALNEADYEGKMIADVIREHFGVEE